MKKNLLPWGKNSNSLINVFLGAVFDKGLIIIISLFLIETIGLENYGKWSVFYQFIIIGSNILINPQVALYKIKTGEERFIIFDKIKFFLSLTIITIISLSFFDDLIVSLFACVSIVSLFTYQYLNTIHRFSSNTSKYTFNSGLRFIIFLGAFLLTQKILNNTFLSLAYAYMASLLVILTIRFSYFLKLEFQNLLDKTEYYLLILYGLVSTLSTGIDKLILEKNEVSMEVIGLYTYVISLAYIPNFIIEVVYKTIQPDIFSCFRKGEVFSDKLKSQIKLGQITIILCNISVPVTFYYFSILTGIISTEFAGSIDVTWILISSIIMAIYSLYHYYNMKIIHFNYTGRLSLSILLLSSFYFFLFFPKINQEIETILGLRFLVLTLITVMTIMINCRISNDN